MCITTSTPIRNETYQLYLQQPKRMCEIVFYTTIDENPYLINALNRNSSHPLFQKYCHIAKESKSLVFITIKGDYEYN